MPLILPNTLANLIPADGDKLQQNFATIQEYMNQEVVTRDGSTGMTSPLLLSGPPTEANQAATKAYVDSTGLIGEIKMFGGDVEPANWMFCRGQTVSRATYAALFAAFGTKFGAGDGSTTFNLPDFRGTSPVGHNIGPTPPNTYFTKGVGERDGHATLTMPAHSHGVSIWSGFENADHSHGVSIWSGGQSVNHYHAPNGGAGDYLMGGGSPHAGYLQRGGTAQPYSGQASTNWANTDHAHLVQGGTGGISANHRHAVNGDTVAAAAVGATNYQPSLSVNFIVKVS